MEREARLALIVSTGLALIEIVEKAVAHYPALIDLLERCMLPSFIYWRYEKFEQDLGAFSAYVRTGERQGIWHFGEMDDPTAETHIVNKEALERGALVMLTHHVALTRWASKEALGSPLGIETLSNPDSEPLTPLGHLALRDIFVACERVPFSADLYPRNFLAPRLDFYLDETQNEAIVREWNRLLRDTQSDLPSAPTSV